MHIAYQVSPANQTTSIGCELQVTVTHPFIPHSGSILTVQGIDRQAGKKILKCSDANGNSIRIEAGFTDYGKQRSGDISADLLCDFSYESLLELSQIVEDMHRLSS